MTREDFVIVCGDFGLWHDTATERWWFDWFEKKNFTILFIDGNHENFDRLYGDEFEVVDFHGGKAHKIRENLYHLMRGYVFELCGKKFFAFGGASSHDISDGVLDERDYNNPEDMIKDYKRRKKRGEFIRINHTSWWEKELPTEDEMEFGLKNLEEKGNKVDFVITHCCPQQVISSLDKCNRCYDSRVFEPDIITEYFDTISEQIHFSKWFFGHYHDNSIIKNDYIMLYEQIVRIV